MSEGYINGGFNGVSKPERDCGRYTFELNNPDLSRMGDDVAHEIRVALYDLNEEAAISFSNPPPAKNILIKVEKKESMLALHVCDKDGSGILKTHIFGFGNFSREIKDYTQCVESYNAGIKGYTTPEQIEPVDMARRELHNAAAARLSEKLSSKGIQVDEATARRLFVLMWSFTLRPTGLGLKDLPSAGPAHAGAWDNPRSNP